MNTLIDTKGIRAKLKAYKAAAAKIEPLRHELTKLEQAARQILTEDRSAIRRTRYEDVYQQVLEATSWKLGKPSTLALLNELLPSLRQAVEELDAARHQARTLLESLNGAIAETTQTVSRETMSLRQAIKQKIVSALVPFTDNRTAEQLAEQVPLLRDFNFQLSCVGIFTDPETGVSKLCSAVDRLAELKTLAA